MFWPWIPLLNCKAPAIPSSRWEIPTRPSFVRRGKDFDARLEALGATRIHPRTDCDVDFDQPAAVWMEAVLTALAAAAPAPSNAIAEAEVTEVNWSKENPYPTRLLTNRLINAEGSSKASPPLT